MRFLILILILASATLSCENNDKGRIVEDFNRDWKFHLGDDQKAFTSEFDDSDWRRLDVPHDWSIEEGYQKEGTGASTGFVPGGIGWYRKAFMLSTSDKGKQITIMFDGVYNNSTVWINGHLLGHRPSGYSSFSYDLSKYLKYDQSENILAVKVDRKAYVDSRWYTGSGIYRKVRLIKKSPLHIAQWGVQITTPNISDEVAEVSIKTVLENSGSEKFDKLTLAYTILDGNTTIDSKKIDLHEDNLLQSCNLQVKQPKLWGIDQPHLYVLKVELLREGKQLDESHQTFGIRQFNFDANTGFSLNGESMKIKGVNLHHDGGAVGAAVPKEIWRYRIEKLKSIGVNAVRLSHNPHSVELLEICDELGMMVMAEAFDEWNRPKGKSLIFLGDNAAPAEAARAYPESFDEWAERDLKNLIKRDFNYPSVIMWSIGNEIEWTFPEYAKTYSDVNGAEKKYYKHIPIYDSATIRKAFDKNTGGVDTLTLIAQKLVSWAKEMDTTRPVTSGSVHPSVALASGYAHSLDVLGFNYRAVEYDAAHKNYPDLKIIGSENWGAYSEWKNCLARDFVSGIFAWTGFAYLGEAGPWPRKGLEISFFDFAGTKTPRGHFYECLWKDTPKVYMVTTPADESEYSYDATDGWTFDINLYEPPFWPELRLWEWYKVYPKWNYTHESSIIVQTYTNCEEAELFLNGVSLGKQKRADFDEDNIIKWLVPFEAGELKVVGYNNGKEKTEHQLFSTGQLAVIQLSSQKSSLKSDGYDAVVIEANLLDENGHLITNADQSIAFDISGDVKILGVDNGWENYVQSHKTNKIITYQGRAIIILQSSEKQGPIEVSAVSGNIKSNTLSLQSK